MSESSENRSEALDQIIEKTLKALKGEGLLVLDEDLEKPVYEEEE